MGQFWVRMRKNNDNRTGIREGKPRCGRQINLLREL